MGKTKIGINLVATLVAFLVSLGINFFLTPYIIKWVGVEAYGFVALANNFIMYISIFTIALNSMAGRFIAIEMHKNNFENARKYYSSTFFANAFGAFFLLAVSSVIIANIQDFITISDNLLVDVKCLMAFILLSFLLEVYASNFSIAYIVKNKLYLSSFLQIKGNAIKVVLLVVLFYFFTPHITYIGLATLAMSIYIRFNDFRYKNKLISNIFFSKKYIQIIAIKEVIMSGIWNTVIRIGNVLSGGLDLFIANIYIGGLEMGILALTKIIPNVINSVVATVANIFMPDFLELYAKKEYELLLKAIKQSMRILSFLLSIPNVIFLSYGDCFFRLWVPSQDENIMYYLSIISILPITIIGPVAVIHNIFTLVNKIKTNALLIIFTGILNTVLVLILLKYSYGWELIIIVGVSSLLSIIRNLFYTVPFGAIYLKCKWYTFFPVLTRSMIAVIVVTFIGIYVKRNVFFICDWNQLLKAITLITFLNMIVQILLVFTESGRKDIYCKIIEMKKGLF